ncbi:MAG: AAA family ATPase [Spirulina sp. SIO3F2]|nr:AAA family ATPase [Spirulina sp. SIO3F2]
MSLATSVYEIKTLIQSFHPIIAIETVEEERVENLLKSATGEMKIPLFEWTVSRGLYLSPGSKFAPQMDMSAPVNAKQATTYDGTQKPLDALRYIEKLNRKAVFLLKDFGYYLKDDEISRQVRELARIFRHNRGALVLTASSLEIPSAIAHETVYYDLKLPGRDELYKVVSEVVRSLNQRSQRVQVQLQDQELKQLVQALSGMTLTQARQVVAYAALDDGKLTADDIDSILHRKAQVIQEDGLLEYFPASENQANLGGFVGLKQWLKRARVGFSAEARELRLPPPKGILIVGVQGCGKSLAAKTIAREWRLPLIKLEAGRLYDKYVGESERNFRRAMTLAESMAPTVLWIDEIEKSFGASGGGGSDGGLSRRMFGAFLTWLQEKSEEVFVVATANDLSQIPPELLRKGRFDEIFFVDLPDEQDRAAILTIHLRSHQQAPDKFDLNRLVQVTQGYSGAEIEQAIVSALYRALSLRQRLDTDLLVTEIESTVPLSVSRAADVDALREAGKNNFVDAKTGQPQPRQYRSIILWSPEQAQYLVQFPSFPEQCYWFDGTEQHQAEQNAKTLLAMLLKQKGTASPHPHAIQVEHQNSLHIRSAQNN